MTGQVQTEMDVLLLVIWSLGIFVKIFLQVVLLYAEMDFERVLKYVMTIFDKM